VTLRDFQAEAIDKIRRKLWNQVNRQIVRHATGLGKSPVMAALPDQLGFKNRMMVVTNRRGLVNQLAGTMREWNPGRTVGIEMGDQRSDGAQIVVASIQTIGDEGSKRLLQFVPEEFDGLCIDECFPAGTLVDGKPIEHYTVGDSVCAYKAGRVAQKTIQTIFKSRVRTLVRVTANSKSTVCTPGHPFLTRRGWVAAADLLVDDEVLRYDVDVHSVRGGNCCSYRVPEGDLASCWEGVLREGLLREVLRKAQFRKDEQNEPQVRFSEDDSEQPNAQTRNPGKGKTYLAKDGLGTSCAGRQRHWLHTGRVEVGGSAPSAGGEFALVSQCRGENQDAKGERLPDLLQVGHCESPSEDRCRSGWKLPLLIGAESARCQERGVLAFYRVDSVEVLQPGSDGTFGGLCSDGYVYNLEVDEYHTYVANGFVVHNCHHTAGKTYLNVLKHFKVFTDTHRLCLGVSAHINRADGKGLGEIFQEIVDDRPIIWGIRNGWLADLRCIRVKTTTSLDNIHTLAGDFNQAELSKEVDTPQRNELIARAWLEHGQDRQTLGYAVDIEHAQHLAEAFKRYGISAEAVWGSDPARDEKMAYHREGKLRVLWNNELLTEGHDDPTVACIAQARPTQSEGLYVQILGRGTRIPKGVNNLLEARAAGIKVSKEDCLVLDFVDNTQRHSLVNLPTLYGMEADTDFRGRSLVSIVDEIEELQKVRPYVDIKRCHDIDKLKSYAEEVDLFQVSFPPEVIQLSEYQWHRTSNGSYVLLLAEGESVCILPDDIGLWHIKGSVNGNEIDLVKPTFEEAIKEADYKVYLFGGRNLRSLVRRFSKWHKEAPTEGQRIACKWNGLKIPAGATRGEVAMKLNWVINAKLQAKKKIA
jgi:superfamily II DNA or RNA helicase